jgi:hypothetical protein
LLSKWSGGSIFTKPTAIRFTPKAPAEIAADDKRIFKWHVTSALRPNYHAAKALIFS